MQSKIIQVLAKNFKGRSFEYHVDDRLLILGPNGSGKSAIIQAMQLALDGFVPGISRTNPAIMDALGGSGPSLYVEVAIKHATAGVIRIGRQYAREKNTVKEILMVDRRKVDSRAFAFALAQSAYPKIVSPDEFLSLSPQRFLLELSAKVEGAAGLDAAATDVEKTKEEVNRINRLITEGANFISKSSLNMARMDLPPGSLSEVQAEIKNRESELQAAQTELRRLEDEAAEAKARDEREAQRLKDSAELTNRLRFPGPVFTDITAPEPDPLFNLEKPPGFVPMDPASITTRGAAAESIRKIITAIVDVDCPTCHGGAALLIAKGELRKWGGA
jgi:DNA repair exonuclease SbcCD ATPase subunit